MFSVIEFFPTIASYQFFKNECIFINHGLFFRVKYFLQLYHFQFFYRVNLYGDYLLIFKIANSRFVENISPEKISHDL